MSGSNMIQQYNGVDVNNADVVCAQCNVSAIGRIEHSGDEHTEEAESVHTHAG